MQLKWDKKRLSVFNYTSVAEVCERWSCKTEVTSENLMQNANTHVAYVAFAMVDKEPEHFKGLSTKPKTGAIIRGSGQATQYF